MEKCNHKTQVSMFVCMFVFLLSAPAYAVNIGIYETSDMDFGNIEYVQVSGSGTAVLSPSGSIVYSSLLSGDGVASPAHVHLTGEVGDLVRISCSKKIKISYVGKDIQIRDIEYVHGLTSSLSTKCRGKNQVTSSHIITGDPNQDTIIMGGSLVLNNLKKLQIGNLKTHGSVKESLIIKSVRHF
jgi:hypothetical protein